MIYKSWQRFFKVNNSTQKLEKSLSTNWQCVKINKIFWEKLII